MKHAEFTEDKILTQEGENCASETFLVSELIIKPRIISEILNFSLCLMHLSSCEDVTP